MTKKTTIEAMAYEEMKVVLPKTSNSAKNDCKQAKRAYILAKSDAKKIIKDARKQRKQVKREARSIIRDARRQRRQARLAYRASKLTLKAKKYDKK